MMATTTPKTPTTKTTEEYEEELQEFLDAVEEILCDEHGLTEFDASYVIENEEHMIRRLYAGGAAPGDVAEALLPHV
jgi:hypothetical protein